MLPVCRLPPHMASIRAAYLTTWPTIEQRCQPPVPVEILHLRRAYRMAEKRSGEYGRWP